MATVDLQQQCTVVVIDAPSPIDPFEHQRFLDIVYKFGGLWWYNNTGD